MLLFFLVTLDICPSWVIIFFHLYFFFLQLLIAITYLFDRYDMWSVGVVILEMILGSPNVFQISDLTRALLDHHLEGWNDSLKELAFR